MEFLLDPGEAVYRDADSAARFHLTDTPLDGTVPAGTYYMSLWVDQLNDIDEANEGNNVSSGTGFVRIGLPPLPRLGAAAASSETFPPSVAPAASFNGLLQPNALTRRVQVIEDPDGTRRVQFLDELPRSHVPPYNLAAGVAPATVGGQALRHLAASPSTALVFDKRNVSADVVNTPIVGARPMPE